MKINKNIRYDNLTIEELLDLYNSLNPNNSKFERENLNCKKIYIILEDVRKKFKKEDLKTEIDINCGDKFCYLNKFKNNAMLDIYNNYYYLNQINFNDVKDWSDILIAIYNLHDIFVVRKVRQKYPELMKKYQEKFNKRSDFIYEEDTSMEFPIEVVCDMIEEEDLDIDLGKDFGYLFEGMRFAENTIDKYFDLECKN